MAKNNTAESGESTSVNSESSSTVGDLLNKALTDQINPKTPPIDEKQNLAIQEYINEQIKSAKIKNDNAEQNVRLRGEHASSIKEMIYFYLLGVGLIVLLVGSERIRLSDTVLVAILGTTTVNVLVLYNLVVKNLFPNND